MNFIIGYWVPRNRSRGMVGYIRGEVTAEYPAKWIYNPLKPGYAATQFVCMLSFFTFLEREIGTTLLTWLWLLGCAFLDVITLYDKGKSVFCLHVLYLRGIGWGEVKYCIVAMLTSTNIAFCDHSARNVIDGTEQCWSFNLVCWLWKAKWCKI